MPDCRSDEEWRQGVHLRSKLRDEDRQWWTRTFGQQSPAQLASRLAHGLPGERSYTFDIDGYGRTFDLEMEGREGNARIWYQATQLDLTDAHFYEDGLLVDETRRGAGLAQRLVGNLADLADELKLPRISLHAENIGGYVWARAGATPVGDTAALSMAMVERLGRVTGGLDSQLAKDAQGLILGLREKPKLLWAIAALDPLVRSHHLFHRTGGERTVKLGQHLLVGTSWRGAIELLDDEARIQFGRWRAKWQENTMVTEVTTGRSPISGRSEGRGP